MNLYTSLGNPISGGGEYPKTLSSATAFLVPVGDLMLAPVDLRVPFIVLLSSDASGLIRALEFAWAGSTKFPRYQYAVLSEF